MKAVAIALARITRLTVCSVHHTEYGVYTQRKGYRRERLYGTVVYWEDVWSLVDLCYALFEFARAVATTFAVSGNVVLAVIAATSAAFGKVA